MEFDDDYDEFKLLYIHSKDAYAPYASSTTATEYTPDPILTNKKHEFKLDDAFPQHIKS
jgi:hypothetical protein